MATVFNALARIQHLPLLDAARSLALAGLPVIPCVPREKSTLSRRGFHDTTTDLDQVSAWWDRRPSANIAIPTGPASGIEVVDIDIGSTGSGFPALDRKSTRLNSSHVAISYAVFCLKKKNNRSRAHTHTYYHDHDSYQTEYSENIIVW